MSALSSFVAQQCSLLSVVLSRPLPRLLFSAGSAVCCLAGGSGALEEVCVCVDHFL
jgi:hypothetical protein